MRSLLIPLALSAASVSGWASVSGAAENAGNAALQYWVAFALCPTGTHLDSATTDDEKVGFGVRVGPELVRYLDGDGERALVHLHRGARLSTCDWSTSLREDGPNAAAPYGRKAHALARLALLRARWRFEHDDWDGGIDDVIATMRLGRHIGRGKIWYIINFGCMLEAMSTGTAAFYLPQMPEKARERLARELDRLPPVTSMREVALYYEENVFDWAIEEFERAEKQGRLFEMVASISGKEAAEKVFASAHDAEGLIRATRAARQLAHQIAEAMFLRPDQYNRLIKEQFAPQLQANPVAVILGPNYESARDEEATAHCRLVCLKTAIDILRRGKSALKDHPDPYGDGPFEYAELDGGFELGSALVYVASGNLRIRMRFGVRQIFPR